MKKLFLLLTTLIVFNLTSCISVRYNKVYSYDDEFRDNSKYYTRINIKPEEKRTEIGSTRIIIEKVKGKEHEEINSYFVIWRSSSSFKSGNEGFMKAENI